MDPKFFRRYADLITEAEQPEQLDEGVMDTIKSAFSKAIQKLLSPEDLQKIASIAQQATGGDLTPTKENAMKLVQALGITQQDVQQAIQSNGSQPVAGAQPVSEMVLLGSDIKSRILTGLTGIGSTIGGGAMAIAGAGGISTGIGLVTLVIGLVLLRVLTDDIKSDANFRKNYKPSTGPDDLDKYIANKAAIKQGKPAPY